MASRFGCTEGQLYTVCVGAIVAATLFVVGVPPVLHHQGDRPAALRSQQGPADADPPGSVGPPPSTTPTAKAPGPEPDADRQVPGSPALSSVPSSTTTTTVTTATTTTVPVTTTTPPGPPAPRRVTDHGYTSSTAEAPADGAEVPEHGLPVAARAGAIDRVSFARLSGQQPVLVLGLVDDESAHRLVALAGVEACAVSQPGWELGAAEPPENGPDYDPRRCVSGVQASDGTWGFDLSLIGPVADDAGIALVPVVEGPATFQITFSARTVG